MKQYDSFIPHFKGYWKFLDKYVTVAQLEELSQEWAKDDAYISLSIRKTSDDQHGIGFEYNHPEGSNKSSFARFKEENSDMLRRRFGNGLAGWDISSSYLPIK